MLKRRDLHWLWFIGAGLLVGIYGVYWKIVHDRAIELMGDQVRAWDEAGYQVTWSEMTTGGFPFDVHARFADPDVIAPPSAGGWRWSADTLSVGLRPWLLDRIVLRPRGRHVVTSNEYGVVDAEADGLEIALRGGATGLKYASVRSGYASAVRRMDGVSVGGFGALDVRLRQDESDLGLYALEFDVAEPEWAEPDGTTPPATALPQRIAARGEMSGIDVLSRQRNLDERALAAWAFADGRVGIEQSVVEWRDGGLAAATGDVSIERNGEWRAELSVNVQEFPRVMANLEALNVDLPFSASQIQSRSGSAPATNSVTIPLSVRDGRAYIYEFVPIGEVDPAY